MKKEIFICSILFVFVMGISFISLSEYDKEAILKEIDIDLIQKNNHRFLNYEILYNHLKNNLADTSLNKNRIKYLDLKRLEKSLLKFSSIKRVDVHCDIKGRLTARIEVREPIARIKNSSGTFYLDSNGLPMDMSNRYSARTLLVLGDVSEKDMKSIHLLINEIKKDDFLSQYIISIKKKKNNYTLYTRTGEHKIELGKLDRINEKFKKLLLFYKLKMGEIGWNKYKVINLRYKNQVIGIKS